MQPHHLVILACITVTAREAATIEDDVKTASACYGNVNNTIMLGCPSGEVISVAKVTHGVKIRISGCPSPASWDTWRASCCEPRHGDDCMIPMPPGLATSCDGLTSCYVIATWSNTNGQCNQDIYMYTTTYMSIHYICVAGPEPETTASSAKTTQEPAVETPLLITTTTTTKAPSATAPSTSAWSPSTRDPTTSLPVIPGGATLKLQTAPGDDEQLTGTMVGAIVAGSAGMLLTLVVFIFYWGRRHLRITSRPQPSVWDYILPSAYTVGGQRGYDHFPSQRSTQSSEGSNIDPGSPGGGHTAPWLPNIAPHAIGVTEGDADVYDDDDVYDDTIYDDDDTSTIDNNSSTVNVDISIEDNYTPPMARQHDNYTSHVSHDNTTRDQDNTSSGGGGRGASSNLVQHPHNATELCSVARTNSLNTSTT